MLQVQVSTTQSSEESAQRRDLRSERQELESVRYTTGVALRSQEEVNKDFEPVQQHTRILEQPREVQMGLRVTCNVVEWMECVRYCR